MGTRRQLPNLILGNQQSLFKGENNSILLSLQKLKHLSLEATKQLQTKQQEYQNKPNQQKNSSG